MGNRTNKFIRWPLIAAVAALWLTVAVLYLLSVQKTDGHLVYTLDDAYIHMAIAKHFAQDGVWGITKYGFSSSSSSLLWTLLLSASYYVFGVNEPGPFILNVVFATALVVVSYFFLEKQKPSMRPGYIFMVLLAVIFFMPLPALIFNGMEHILQSIVAILFVHASSRFLSEENASPVAVISLAPLVTLSRYEGLFVVLPVCLLLLRKRWSHSILLGLAALLPLCVYGIISYSHGWFALPNSVLVKGKVLMLGQDPGITDLVGYTVFGRLLFPIAFPRSSSYLVFIIISGLIYYISLLRDGTGDAAYRRNMVLILVMACFLHAQFSFVGWFSWFMRYDAYLVYLGLVILLAGLYEYLPRKISLTKYTAPKYAAVFVLALFPFVSLAERGGKAITIVPQATKNIYEQQYQMGLFLKGSYENAPTVAYDIGLINFLSDIRCIDMGALGSIDVAKEWLRRLAQGQRFLETEAVEGLTRPKGARIAVIYDRPWFRFPSYWVKVGEWKIPDNVVCGGDTVSFFATGVSEEGLLRSNLKKFSPRLPKDVVQSGSYL